MAALKPDRYYDLRCDFCYCMWSTDFDGGRGMYTNRDLLVRQARHDGWRVRQGKNACPECVRNRPWTGDEDPVIF